MPTPLEILFGWISAHPQIVTPVLRCLCGEGAAPVTEVPAETVSPMPIPVLVGDTGSGYRITGGSDMRSGNVATLISNTSGRGGAFQAPPGMRLPSSHKVAFNAVELFAQQANMETHDTGLQMLLDTVFHVYRQLYDVECSASDFAFSANFASPPNAMERRVVFHFQRPHPDQLDVSQTFLQETWQPCWCVYSTKLSQIITIVGSGRLRDLVRPVPPAALTMDEDGRELRAIVLDDPE